LGELYLQLNDLENAERQVSALRNLCATNCEELENLRAEMATYKEKLPPTTPKKSK
jgi:hypothetical protein